MTDQPVYQVLARKHRPTDFDSLIGQEAMVRTLRNAFESGRIAHAFVLTGVRGVGKTTTARIIAKGLNCTAQDGPTVKPCGQCPTCRAISENRCLEVFEIDAASHTGVDFIRDLNEMVRYAPVDARYKVIILDEAHMLSTAAFNALLKTLEEPPPHVKFFFATTEIRKMPATVLSRCQRFDLRRIEPETMLAFLADIAGKEGALIEPDALALIARAAEGSARDALTLMDRVIAHGAGDAVDAATARRLLGFADRARGFDLLERIMAGDAKGALEELGAQYAEGAEPEDALRALAELVHWVSVVKVDPAAAEDPTAPEGERARASELAQKLPMRALARSWQMLLKALDEVARAPSAMMAAEMAVIRLTHVADLPSPEDLLRKLSAPGADAASAPVAPAAPTGGGPTAALAMAGGGAVAVAAEAPELPDFAAVLALLRRVREMTLLVHAERSMAVLAFAPGRIGFQPRPGLPDDIPDRMAETLRRHTGRFWLVEPEAGEAATVEETRRAALDRRLETLAARPDIAALRAVFPDATLTLRPAAVPPAPEEPDEDALEFDPDWSPVDPFDED